MVLGTNRDPFSEPKRVVSAEGLVLFRFFDTPLSTAL